MRLTWDPLFLNSMASFSAISGESFMPSIKAYSNVTLLPVFKKYLFPASINSSTESLLAVGTKVFRRLLSGAWREIAKPICRFSSASLSMADTNPIVDTQLEILKFQQDTVFKLKRKQKNIVISILGNL